MNERPSPLHDTTARAGAAFGEEAGWTMPLHYGDPAGEYRQARSDAALFDLSHRGKVELAGPEAAVFLHNLLTNDVKGLPYSHGCESFLCNAQARVLAYALVYRLKIFDDAAYLSSHDAFWLDLDPGLGDKVARHLDRHLISERAEIADRTATFAHLHLAGPQAPALAAADGIADLAPRELMQNGWGADTVQFRRNDRLGVPGYDIICPAGRAEWYWSHLLERGAKPAGLTTENVLRDRGRHAGLRQGRHRGEPRPGSRAHAAGHQLRERVLSRPGADRPPPRPGPRQPRADRASRRGERSAAGRGEADARRQGGGTGHVVGLLAGSGQRHRAGVRPPRQRRARNGAGG